ncbi:MAG: hypothetical protein U1D66_06890 [Erythrobacter sp.]|nr:hypothetical protein [Erythrobacter sp.]
MVRKFHGWKRLSLLAVLATGGCGQAEPSATQAAADDGQKKVVKAAEAAAVALPAELEKIIAEGRKACGGKVGSNYGKTNTADFNADGKPDYILSQENFLCADEPGGQLTWGWAGPNYEFLVSSPAGYKLDQGFSSAYGIDIVKRPSGDVVQLQHENMSAEGCPGVFIITWSWTGKKMDLTDHRNAEGHKVNELGCLVSASGTLPIRLGYYGHAGDGCAVALRSWTGGITIDDRYWRDLDGDYPVRPVKSLENGKFKLGEAADVIRVTGPDSFVADEGTDYERRFIWCAERAPK